MRDSRTILLIIALIFVAPFLRGLVGGIGGIVITILFLPFLAAFSLGVVAVGCFISGIACMVSGIPLTFHVAAAGLLTMGIGCLLTSLGILAFLLLLFVATRILPRILYRVADFFSGLFYRRGEEDL